MCFRCWVLTLFQVGCFFAEGFGKKHATKTRAITVFLRKVKKTTNFFPKKLKKPELFQICPCKRYLNSLSESHCLVKPEEPFMNLFKQHTNNDEENSIKWYAVYSCKASVKT